MHINVIISHLSTYVENQIIETADTISITFMDFAQVDFLTFRSGNFVSKGGSWAL